MDNQEMIKALVAAIEYIDKLHDAGVQNAAYKVNAFQQIRAVIEQLQEREVLKEEKDESTPVES